MSTILILEDEPFIALDLEETLVESGHQDHVTLSTCKDASAWLDAHTPAAALSPGIHGQVRVPSSGEQQLSASVDGQESMQLYPDDSVTVRPAEEKLPLLLPKNLTFADILGAKLRWSGTAI